MKAKQFDDAKEFLRRYEYADLRAKRFEDEYRREHDLIGNISINYDGMPHGNGVTRKTENEAIKLAEKAERCVEARLDAIRIRQEVFDVVMGLEGLEADVLVERYLNLDESGHQQTWEAVCDRVHYSWPTVRTAWHRGLNMVEEILKYKNLQ